MIITKFTNTLDGKYYSDIYINLINGLSIKKLEYLPKRYSYYR